MTEAIRQSAYFIAHHTLRSAVPWWFGSLAEYIEPNGDVIVLHPFQAAWLGYEDQVLEKARELTPEEYDELWEQHAG